MTETFEIKHLDGIICESCGQPINGDGIQNVPHGSRWTHYPFCLE